MPALAEEAAVDVQPLAPLQAHEVGGVERLLFALIGDLVPAGLLPPAGEPLLDAL